MGLGQWWGCWGVYLCGVGFVSAVDILYSITDIQGFLPIATIALIQTVILAGCDLPTIVILPTCQITRIEHQ